MGVTDRDQGYEALLRRLPTLAADMQAGVFGEKADAQHPNSKLTVGELTAVHEFGLGHVPERAIVRGYFDDAQRDMLALAATLAQQVVRGNAEPQKLHEELGKFVVEGMQKRMDEGIDPPLLASTINEKQGPPVPVEDTLTIRNALDFRWKGAQ